MRIFPTKKEALDYLNDEYKEWAETGCAHAIYINSTIASKFNLSTGFCIDVEWEINNTSIVS